MMVPVVLFYFLKTSKIVYGAKSQKNKSIE